MDSTARLKLEDAFERAVEKRFKISGRQLSYYPRYFFYQLSKWRLIFIRTRTFLGTNFYCYLPDYFWTWNSGVLGDPAEIIFSRFLLINLREGDVFFDVGSNCGFYAVLSAVLVGEKGGVHAFEPTPKIFRQLKKNTKNFKNIRTQEAAVADKPGEADFYLNPLFTVANSLTIKPATSHQTTKVKVVTLDDYCYTHKIRPTFVKLDVEGAERAVVLGGQTILAECSPVVSLEILDQATGADFSAAEKLVSLGYVPYELMPNAELKEISLPRIIALCSSRKNVFHNFIFKKR